MKKFLLHAFAFALSVKAIIALVWLAMWGFFEFGGVPWNN